MASEWRMDGGHKPKSVCSVYFGASMAVAIRRAARLFPVGQYAALFFVGLPRRTVMPYDCGIPRVPIACSNVQTADLRRSTLPEQEGGARQLSEFCAHFVSQS